MNEPATSKRSLSLTHLDLHRPTRLSIADLFLITLGTAIAIWILQPPEGPRHIGVVTVNVVMAPLYGCVVAAVFISGLRNLNNSRTFANEPGHWLLLIIGTVFLGIGLLVRAGPALSAELSSEVLRGAYALLFLAGIAFLMISLLVIAVSTGTIEDETVYWRFVFRMIAWTLILGFLGSLLIFSGGIEFVLIFTPPLILAVALVAAVISDLWQRNYRDFWHWLGIAAFAGLPMHVALLIIAEQFAQ